MGAAAAADKSSQAATELPVRATVVLKLHVAPPCQVVSTAVLLNRSDDQIVNSSAFCHTAKC